MDSRTLMAGLASQTRLVTFSSDDRKLVKFNAFLFSRLIERSAKWTAFRQLNVMMQYPIFWRLRPLITHCKFFRWPKPCLFCFSNKSVWRVFSGAVALLAADLPAIIQTQRPISKHFDPGTMFHIVHHFVYTVGIENNFLPKT